MSITSSISWPIPLPTVFIPFSSKTVTISNGLALEIPPETKFSSFKYNSKSGPFSSKEAVVSIPPIIRESLYPLASTVPSSAYKLILEKP